MIFYNSDIGEFWIELILITQPPLSTSSPYFNCELGRFACHFILIDTCVRRTSRWHIEINNPTTRTYHLTARIDNSNVYSLESYSVDDESEVIPFNGRVQLPSSRTVSLNIIFQPQECGEYLNSGEIIFHCQEVTFLLKWQMTTCLVQE